MRVRQVILGGMVRVNPANSRVWELTMACGHVVRRP